MKYLIKKDFIATGLYLIGATFAIPFLTMIAILTMVDHFGGLVVGAFTMIVIIESIYPALLFILVDSSSGADKIFASMPVKRSTIVLSRYSESIIQLIYNFTLVILTCLSAIYIFQVRDEMLTKMITFNGIFAIFLFLIFILTIIFPFMFKSGVGGGLLKATISLVILFILLPAADYVLYLLQDYITFDPDFFLLLADKFITWLKTQPAYIINLLPIVTVLITLSLSILLSIRFYNKLDIE
jgi:hypothetical protein